MTDPDDRCHLCGDHAEDMCESCDQMVCLECSTPDPEHSIRFCDDCVERLSGER